MMRNSPDPDNCFRPLHFMKMHGLGNDFVVIDARDGGDPVTPELARVIGDRNRGVGFDQLLVINKGTEAAHADVMFWNADGSVAAACGNGTRCVARLLMEESGARSVRLRTARGLLHAEDVGGGLIRVNMGPPEEDWRKIPLAHAADVDALPFEGAPSAVGMGNPHCVFVVSDVSSIDIADLGSRIEHDPLFPERTNVEFAQVIDRKLLRLRVWERGGVITHACGSGACAALVVTARRGLTERQVEVQLDGGSLSVDWQDDGVWMTGPTEKVFEGNLCGEVLAGLK